jgi:glutamate/tyrosine decarboxylase-like PLP-dependent enzyme
LEEVQLDEINQQIMVELQEEGTAIVSGTRIGGKFSLHVANTNHRSKWEDFQILTREVIRLGELLNQRE